MGSMESGRNAIFCSLNVMRVEFLFPFIHSGYNLLDTCNMLWLKNISVLGPLGQTPKSPLLHYMTPIIKVAYIIQLEEVLFPWYKDVA